MRTLLFGGFYGSGKTTIITKLIASIQGRGELVCVIENEIGENAIDDLLIRETKVNVTTLSGGCVCCQITGSLIEALIKIRRDYTPDWVIVELSGIAYLADMKEKIAQYMPGPHEVTTISILDAARWDILIKAASIVMINQLEGAEITVVNKLDLLDDFKRISEEAARTTIVRQIIPYCATRDSGDFLFSEIRKLSGGQANE